MHNSSDNNLKISFLSEEVKRLNDTIADYEEMLKLNKEALKSALNLHNSGDVSRKTTDSGPREEDNQIAKALKNVIAKLEKENLILSNNLEKMNKDWSVSQSRALINEQIADAAHNRELEVIKDYEKKIKNLYDLVSKKEKRIEELEKTKPIIEQEGLIIQNREIISPNEKVMKLHNELEVQKWALIKVTKEMAKVQEEKKELLTINFNMANEIAKLQSERKLSSSPKNFDQHGMVDSNSHHNDAILDFHKKFLNESSSSGNQELSPENSPLPEKIASSATKPDKIKIPPKAMNIPKLDLTQAKKIQEINAKKITQQPNMANVDPQFQEKYKSLENELAKTKKMLQKEMCQNKMLSSEVETLQKENKSLKVKNETIMNLHRIYEEKWEKISHNYKFLKDFYRNCLIKAMQKRLSVGFLGFFHFYFPQTSFETLYSNFEKGIINSEIYNISEDELNEKLIEFEVSQIFESNPLEYEIDMNSSIRKEKYQRYLIKIANELEQVYKIPTKIYSEKMVSSNNNNNDNELVIDNKEYVSFPLKGRIKRSLSNNLEYISSNKKNEFNNLFMFYNQEILDYMRFKKLMQIKQAPMTENQYFYENVNQGEEIAQSQEWHQQENLNEENYFQNNQEENK